MSFLPQIIDNQVIYGNLLLEMLRFHAKIHKGVIFFLEIVGISIDNFIVHFALIFFVVDY